MLPDNQRELAWWIQQVTVVVCACCLTMSAPTASGMTGTAGTATCGNGVLEPGEACDACPADCTVRPCHTGSGSYRVAVELSTPPNKRVAAATVLVTYRAGTVRLPGKGSAPSVRERVRVVPPATFAAVNDRGYALRVALARPEILSSGHLLDVEFDACGRDAAPSIDDFRCLIESCGGESGVVQGCACSVSPAQDALAGAR